MPKDTPHLTFAAFLDHVNDGDLADELDESLRGLNRKLAERAQQTDTAKGELTIVLKFKHDARGNVEVTSDVKVKEPSKQRGKSIFYVDQHSELTPNHPKQARLPMVDLGRDRARDLPVTETPSPRSV